MVETMKFNSISVFFPAYNDAETIEGLTLKTKKLLDRISEDYEITIVNDASPDNLGAIADKLSNNYQHVRVIHHSKNRGVGEALKTGFNNAQKEFVFYTDGDAQYDINELETLLPYTREADVVIGYRRERADSILRRVVANVYAILNRILFGLNVRDIDCSFKLMRRSIFNRIKIESRSGFIDAELLLKIKKCGYQIKEVGVSHYPRPYGRSQCFRMRTVFPMIMDMIRMRLKGAV